VELNLKIKTKQNSQSLTRARAHVLCSLKSDAKPTHLDDHTRQSNHPRDAADVDAREPTLDAPVGARDRRVGVVARAWRASSEKWMRDDVADTAGPTPIPTDVPTDDGTGGEGRG
jgi:hypothetical protein